MASKPNGCPHPRVVFIRKLFFSSGGYMARMNRNQRNLLLTVTVSLLLLVSWLVRWLEAIMGGHVQTANR